MAARSTFVAVALALTTAPIGVAQRPATTTLRVVNPRVEYHINPIGLDAAKPRLSWQLEGDGRGIVQTAYQIRVARTERDLRANRRLAWDSGRVASDESIQRVYEGEPLASRQRYYWQVRAWDASDAPTQWSAPAFWEMGLLRAADWRASWIEPALDEDATKPGPVPMLRREFKIAAPFAAARVYVTAHGV